MFLAPVTCGILVLSCLAITELIKARSQSPSAFIPIPPHDCCFFLFPIPGRTICSYLSALIGRLIGEQPSSLDFAPVPTVYPGSSSISSSSSSRQEAAARAARNLHAAAKAAFFPGPTQVMAVEAPHKADKNMKDRRGGEGEGGRPRGRKWTGKHVVSKIVRV